LKLILNRHRLPLHTPVGFRYSSQSVYTGARSKMATSVLAGARVEIACLVPHEELAKKLTEDFLATDEKVQSAVAVNGTADLLARVKANTSNAVCIDLFESA